MGIKNAEFYVNTKSENKISKKCTIKKLFKKMYKLLQYSFVSSADYKINLVESRYVEGL